MCTIDGDTFYSLMRITWIRDSGASCHITNNDTGMYDITDINESIQGSSSIMPTTKKSKLCVNVCQVNQAEWVHTLLPVKFCPKAGENLFSLMCKLLHGNEISSDHQNDIMVSTTCGDIILVCQIKTHDGWVARVKFLHETNNKRVQSAMSTHEKNINNLHIELGHPSETITHASTKALGIKVTGTLNHVKIVLWVRPNKAQ